MFGRRLSRARVRFRSEIVRFVSVRFQSEIVRSVSACSVGDLPAPESEIVRRVSSRSVANFPAPESVSVGDCLSCESVFGPKLSRARVRFRSEIVRRVRPSSVGPWASP